MNDEYELDGRALARAEALADGLAVEVFDGQERAQVYALVSIAESLHTLTRFLIEKEEGTS